ncbi:copper chaperone PCu(A)C [Acidimangrovimonas sediminis]|uniref:copper chaperone PCu(A)C n=1 Tax=Acidimangrovimonas sediminis TaxID=2056283 RepID=UPI000C7FD402|nr:copper chaperone PCu(A)C [Acidimangrovimonas sediminis]
MTFPKPILAAPAAVLAAVIATASGVLPAFAGEIIVTDAYARVSTPMSKSGAAFMEIRNAATTPDRLVGATADAAAVTELHTHKEGANGVMSMLRVDAIAVPADGVAMLARGGDHLMLMGLKHPLKQGDVVHVTLEFEHAGKVAVDVPVDLERKGPMAGAGPMGGQMEAVGMKTGN